MIGRLNSSGVGVYTLARTIAMQSANLVHSNPLKKSITNVLWLTKPELRVKHDNIKVVAQSKWSSIDKPSSECIGRLMAVALAARWHGSRR